MQQQLYYVTSDDKYNVVRKAKCIDDDTYDMLDGNYIGVIQLEELSEHKDECLFSLDEAKKLQQYLNNEIKRARGVPFAAIDCIVGEEALIIEYAGE